MTDRFPDIEIYLHQKTTAEQIAQWLTDALACSLNAKGANRWQAKVHGQNMDIVFNPKAIKGFASLWFKQNHTPWNTDLECALAANQALNTEVRCAISGWQEEQGESEVDTWIKVINGQSKTFTWF